MKTLSEFIKEELDDNVLWLLDKWFDNNEEEKNKFISIISNFGSQRSINVKELSSFVWEEIILHFIGGNINNKIKDEINGIIISIRKDFCFLQIWFKKYEKNNINDISNYLRDILFIPKEIDLDVKSFTKHYDNYYRRNSYKGK